MERFPYSTVQPISTLTSLCDRTRFRKPGRHNEIYQAGPEVSHPGRTRWYQEWGYYSIRSTTTIALLLCRFIVDFFVAMWRCSDEAEQLFVNCTNTAKAASLRYVEILLWYQSYLSYQNRVGILIKLQSRRFSYPRL